MPNKYKKILVCEDEKPIAKALVLKLNHDRFLRQSVSGLPSFEYGSIMRLDFIDC